MCVGIDRDNLSLSDISDLEALIYEAERAEARASLLGVLKARPIPPFTKIQFPVITRVFTSVSDVIYIDSLTHVYEDPHVTAWRGI